MSDAQHEAAASAFPLRRQTGLLLQIAILLTVAIIPVGMVAIVQTQRAVDAAERIYLDSLRAQTMEAATPEREAIMRALGVARSLSDAIAVLGPGDDACRQLMQRSAATNPGVLFVGWIAPPGVSPATTSDGTSTSPEMRPRRSSSPIRGATCVSTRQATSPAIPS
jgi:hypothetical protein